jgi:hypothetical protein
LAGIDTTVNPKITANLPNPALLSANVWGNSPTGNTVGVAGSSVSADGVWGTSKSGNGMEGTSTSGPGVSGSSQSGDGVSAISANSNGIYAKGNPAGLFDGDVTVNGNLGVRSAVTAASLKTSGQVNAGSVATAGVVTAGSVTTSGNVTANDVVLTGADLAEDFSTADVPIEPGTVMVINETGALDESSRAYDRRVAGVVSGAGSFRPGIVMDRAGAPGKQTVQVGNRRVTVALVGKVFCKVDAGYGAIAVGDLLTTSPTPGHAMKADDNSKAFGAVIGKALASLGSGKGLIPVLVALQ